MVTHSSTSRPVQCLCMAERTGCPVFTDLWSYVQVGRSITILYIQKIDGLNLLVICKEFTLSCSVQKLAGIQYCDKRYSRGPHIIASVFFNKAQKAKAEDISKVWQNFRRILS